MIQMESEPDRPPPSDDPVADHDASDAERHRGFRVWMAESNQSLRVFLLITAYVSLMLFLISFIAFRGASAAPKIFAGAAVGSFLVAFVLLKFSVPVEKRNAAMRQIYHKPRTERAEKVVAVMLWLLAIGALLAFLLLKAHHR
jgi:uncharacterized protein with PQ loop repeat